jgi:two-component system response regulator NreC
MLVADYVREIRSRGAQDSYDLLTSREREILQPLAETQVE